MTPTPTKIAIANESTNSSDRRYLTLDEVRSIEAADFDGLGQHLIIDFYDCQSIPSTAKSIEQLMLATAGEIKATVVTSSFHEFSPHGLSGVVVIAESHLAAHTWPEHKVVCIDLFTCSNEMRSIAGLAFLFESLSAGSMTVASFARGHIKRADN